MEKPIQIFKRSIQTFSLNYQYFTIIATFLLLPVSISILLSVVIETSSIPLLSTIRTRLLLLFNAAGFPPLFKFFSLLNLKLSQTISSSIFSLPFTLTFFLVAKSAILQSLMYNKSSFSCSLYLYNPLLLTYFCNSAIILSAHSVGLCILFLLFNFFETLGFNTPNFQIFLSFAGVVIYSTILAQTLNTCSLAFIVAGVENFSGFSAILKAYILIKGRFLASLALALPVNMGLAFLESLFQYQVLRSHDLSEKFNFFTFSEGLVIAYFYSFFILSETIINFIFYKNCKSSLKIEWVENIQDHYRIQLNQEEEPDDNDESIFSN